MADTTAQARTQEALACLPSVFPSWEMVVQCAGRCAPSRVPCSHLPQRHTLGEIIPRLRCQRCSKPAEIVALSRPSRIGHAGDYMLLYGRPGAKWRGA